MRSTVFALLFVVLVHNAMANLDYWVSFWRITLGEWKCVAL